MQKWCHLTNLGLVQGAVQNAENRSVTQVSALQGVTKIAHGQQASTVVVCGAAQHGIAMG